MSSSKQYMCTVCKKVVRNNQCSIGCCICDNFFHIACIKVTKEQHSYLYKNKVFHYKCNECDNKKIVVKKDKIIVNQGDINVSDSNIDSVDIIAELKLQCEKLKSDFLKQVEDLNKKLDNFMNAANIDFNIKVQQMEDKLKNCYAVVKQAESTNTATIQDLEVQNDILQRRLNRADIVINGLPDGILNLREPIVKIATLCNIELSPLDIQHCCYFSNGKSVIVKFNSVYARDCIMANYHRKGALLLSDVLDVNVRSRVYLNDHLNRAASKLMYICRRLKKFSKIKKFKLINADRPRAQVEMLNGAVKVVDINDCAEWLDEGDTSASNEICDNGE